MEVRSFKVNLVINLNPSTDLMLTTFLAFATSKLGQKWVFPVDNDPEHTSKTVKVLKIEKT